MKAFVVSDTHDRLDTLRRFLDILRSAIGPVYLVHLGDVVSPFTLRYIVESLPESVALRVILGNNDGDKVLLSRIAEVADQPEELELCGMRAIAFHGFKSPELTERVVSGIACGGRYDVVMYGHTHRFRLEKLCSSYLLNPGTLSGYLAERATFALVDCETLRASIIDLDTGMEVLSSRIAVEPWER